MSLAANIGTLSTGAREAPPEPLSLWHGLTRARMFGDPQDFADAMEAEREAYARKRVRLRRASLSLSTSPLARFVWRLFRRARAPRRARTSTRIAVASSDGPAPPSRSPSARGAS